MREGGGQTKNLNQKKKLEKELAAKKPNNTSTTRGRKWQNPNRIKEREEGDNLNYALFIREDVKVSLGRRRRIKTCWS